MLEWIISFKIYFSNCEKRGRVPTNNSAFNVTNICFVGINKRCLTFNTITPSPWWEIEYLTFYKANDQYKIYQLYWCWGQMLNIYIYIAAKC
jgi:hypothetical protein